MASVTPAALHLLSLHPSTSVSRFLGLVRSAAPSAAPFDPIYVAQPHHIIHRPRRLTRSALLSNRFDLLIILPAAGSRDPHTELEAFPHTDGLRALVSAHLVLHVSLPEHARSFLSMKPRNSFLAPTYTLPKEWTDDIVPPESAVVQEVVAEEANPTCTLLTPMMAQWLRDFTALKQGQGSISIMTLAALSADNAEKFEAFQNEVSHGLGYPRGERSTAFSIDGPDAYESPQDRVLGSIADGSKPHESWNSAEIARWPDIRYWAEMLSSKHYRALEEKHGISDGVLQDKCIICLTDIHSV